MGGSIGVTLIKPDGEVLKMCRWTNTLPSFIMDMGFINKKETHIEEYLESWLDMKKDWEENGPDGPFVHNMTDAYFPYDHMSPTGYGLVVIDMKENKIFTCQGYTQIDEGFYSDRDEKVNQGRYERVKTFEKEGRTTIAMDWGGGAYIIKFDLSPFTVYRYTENAEGYAKMKKDLEQHYTFTEEEEKQWTEFIEEHNQYE